MRKDRKVHQAERTGCTKMLTRGGEPRSWELRSQCDLSRWGKRVGLGVRGAVQKPGRASEAILREQAFVPNMIQAAGKAGKALGVQSHFTQPDSRSGKAVLKR